MILRSSSTPILKSWISSNYVNVNPNTNPSPNNINELTLSPTPLRTNSTSSFTTSSPPTSPNFTSYPNPFKRAAHLPLPELETRDPPRRPKTTPLQRLFSSSGLEEEVSSAAEDCGGGSGMNGGDVHGGSGGGFNNNNNDEFGSMEEYYQKMIKADPGNPLLLGNYARFLKDVRGNLAKAEEYCERAILDSPKNDANILSLYANIIWQHRRDVQRADCYFDQAIKAAPHDCYIIGSYAKFLWDVEDEEIGEQESQYIVCNPSPSPPNFLEIPFYGTPITTT